MPNSRTTTGLPPGVLAGATGPRLLAALVEVGPVWLLVGLAALFALVLNGSVLVVVLCLVIALAWAALVWAQRATRAAGPGMRLDSLQVVGLSDGRPLGWGRVLLRWLVFAGLTITVVGLIAMLIVLTRHPRRQGWHDLAANAVVIKERPLAPPRPKAAVARTARPKQAATGSAASAATKSSPRPPAVSDTSATETPPAATAVSTAAVASTEAEETVVVEAEDGQGASVAGPAAAGSQTAVDETDQSQSADEATDRDRRVGGPPGVDVAPGRRAERRGRWTRPAGPQSAAAGG